MALVLVEGEKEIVSILNASNVSTTAQAPAKNASASQLVTGVHCNAIIALIAGLAMMRILVA